MSAALEEAPASAPSREPIVLRHATQDDLLTMLGMGREMHAEIHYGAFSEIRVQAVIEEVLRSGIIILSVKPDGVVCGSVGLVPEQPWWSEDWQLADRWLFVRQEFRQEGHAAALLDRAVSIARDNRLPLLMAHVGGRAPGKRRLLQRRLGDPVGAIFFLPPE